MNADGRFVRGLQYVVEGLLAAFLHLVDTRSEEGRSQLPTYGVRRYSDVICPVFGVVPIGGYGVVNVWRGSLGVPGCQSLTDLVVLCAPSLPLLMTSILLLKESTVYILYNPWCGFLCPSSLKLH